MSNEKLNDYFSIRESKIKAFKKTQRKMSRSQRLSWEKRRCDCTADGHFKGMPMFCIRLKGHKGKHKAIIEWK